MKQDLRFERHLRHSPERVWRALTDSKELSVWYFENDFRPVVGHKFTFRPAPDTGFEGTLQGEVILVDTPFRLVYTFHGGSMKRETVVTWTLTPDSGGTLLMIQHTGFTGLSEAALNTVMNICPSRFLNRLAEVLDRAIPVEV
jgi:uncharacterized protein YndB with AHSA1/START domain